MYDVLCFPKFLASLVTGEWQAIYQERVGAVIQHVSRLGKGGKPLCKRICKMNVFYDCLLWCSWEKRIQLTAFETEVWTECVSMKTFSWLRIWQQGWQKEYRYVSSTSHPAVKLHISCSSDYWSSILSHIILTVCCTWKASSLFPNTRLIQGRLGPEFGNVSFLDHKFQNSPTSMINCHTG